MTITPTGSIAGTIDTGGAPPAEMQISLADPALGVWREEAFFRTIITRMPGTGSRVTSSTTRPVTVIVGLHARSRTLPQGRVRIVVRPKDAGASEYLRGGGIANVAPPAPADVGDLIVVKRRIPRNTRAGDLGSPSPSCRPTPIPSC